MSERLFYIIAILILSAVCAGALLQRDIAIHQYEDANVTIEQRDDLIEGLVAIGRLQIEKTDRLLAELERLR